MYKKIMNYSTSVPVNKTIADIQQLLIRTRARSILFDYDDQGSIRAVMFKLVVDNGVELPFRLPAKVDQAYQVLHAGKTLEWKYKEARMENARMVAWRIVHDWLKAQLAIIELEMVKPQEVFLPYLVVGNNTTLYENMEQNQFRLPEGNR